MELKLKLLKKLVPETVKMSSSLESFKLEIRKWEPQCHGRLFTIYLQHIGFVNVI